MAQTYSNSTSTSAKVTDENRFPDNCSILFRSSNVPFSIPCRKLSATCSGSVWSLRAFLPFLPVYLLGKRPICSVRRGRCMKSYPHPKRILKCAFGSMKNVPSTPYCPNFPQVQRIIMQGASFLFRRPVRFNGFKVVDADLSRSSKNLEETQFV